MILKALAEKMLSDATLTALLATYQGEPAIFSIDPAPGDADPPYIVVATIPVHTAFDTKTSRGRSVWCDIRCYTDETGSSILIDQIAERVRTLFHREPIMVDDYDWVLSECIGPLTANEDKAYGRIVTVKTIIEEN